MTIAFCEYKKIVYICGMENNMIVRLKTKADVIPTLPQGQSYEDFEKQYDIQYLPFYGSIGSNVTTHLLKCKTFLINGERVIDFVYSGCGVGYKYGGPILGNGLSVEHLNCAKCLKRLNKGA